MLKVGLIVGSTRPNRFADTPVQWLVEGASARRDLRLTVLDLRDNRLPGGSQERFRQRVHRVAPQAHRVCGLRRRWRGARDRDPARRGHRVADGADQARSEHRDGAFPRHPAKGPFPERLRLPGAKPGRDVRSPGVVGRGIESGTAKSGRWKRPRGLIAAVVRAIARAATASRFEQYSTSAAIRTGPCWIWPVGLRICEPRDEQEKSHGYHHQGQWRRSDGRCRR